MCVCLHVCIVCVVATCPECAEDIGLINKVPFSELTAVSAILINVLLSVLLSNSTRCF